MANKRIFRSKFLVFSLIFSFILLITAEASPGSIDHRSGKEFKPVVRVREAGEAPTPAQEERFEQLIEEGKRLLQEEMDYNGAITKFKEAQGFAITREQRAEVLYYLSLAYYATIEEKGSEEFDKAVRGLIEVDYYREPDKLLCPPRYMELFQEIKKSYGALKVQSKPAGADVYLYDGKESVGKTPLIIGIRAGSVRVRVKKEKREKADVVRVVAGEVRETPVYELKGKSSLIYVVGGIALAGGLGAVLLAGGGGKGGGNGGASAPTTGSIQVSSNPTGAKIYLDGTDTGKTTNTTLTNISPGSHTVKLEKEGYREYEGNVSVSAGQTATISANLTKHTISITNPTSSTIWTKGDEVEISWTTSNSSGFQRNIGINAGSSPVLNPRNIMTPLFQRRAFRSGPSLRRQKREGGECSPGNSEVPSNDTSLLQGLPEKFHSLNKRERMILQRTRDRERTGKNSILGMIHSSVTPSIYPGTFKRSGDMKALIINNVSIELYRGNNRVQTIVSNTENDGLYTWTVSSFLAEGKNYKVRVSCAGESGVYGESNQFWITGYELLTKWGSEGSGSGQFYYPLGVAVDNLGNVYIADYGNFRIQKFTSDGTYITEWGSYGNRNGQFDEVYGIAVDNSFYVYVTDKDGQSNHRIQKFTSDGTFVTKWGSYGSGNGQVDDPCGIAVSNPGYVYVADRDNHRIQKFTSNGIFVAKWGTFGSGAGQFAYPCGVAYGAGYVYVADTENHRIQKFTPDGTFVKMWGSKGSEDGQFGEPEGLAVDSSGNVCVADTLNHRMQKFTPDGTFITKWGTFGSEDGQFDTPFKLAVDSSDNVYVSDTYNSRIQKFGLASAIQNAVQFVYSPSNSQFLNRNLKPRLNLLNPPRLVRPEKKQR